MRYQVTLICESGKYKPVSTIVEIENPTDKATIQNKGITKICITKRWDKRDLKAYNNSLNEINNHLKKEQNLNDEIAKNKNENNEIIEENAELGKENAQIKEEKYASGEWKRPAKEREV